MIIRSLLFILMTMSSCAVDCNAAAIEWSRKEEQDQAVNTSTTKSLLRRRSLQTGSPTIEIASEIAEQRRGAQMEPAEEEDNAGNHHASPWIASELFFGLSFQRDDGNSVDIPLTEFEEFVDRVVTPLFPDGLTWVQTKGQYRNDEGIVVKENSIQMSVYSPTTNTEVDNDTNDTIAYHHFESLKVIAETYSIEFQQESVLVVSDLGTLCFVGGEGVDENRNCQIALDTRRRRRRIAGAF